MTSLTLQFVVNPRGLFEPVGYISAFESTLHCENPLLICNPSRPNPSFLPVFRSCMRNGPDTRRFTSTSQSISSGNMISVPLLQPLLSGAHLSKKFITSSSLIAVSSCALRLFWFYPPGSDRLAETCQTSKELKISLS